MNLESILKKHNETPTTDNDAYMLDVDQYLHQLNEVIEDKTLKSDDSVRHHDADIQEESQFETSSNFERQRQGSAAVSKRSGGFGMSKKNMKDFMKNQLAKTKQTGQDAVYKVCKYFIIGSHNHSWKYSCKQTKKAKDKHKRIFG